MSSYIEYYRYLASLPTIHHLAGRGDDTATTTFANARVLEALQLEPDDSLLDIGCGDGSLLKAADGLVSRRTGIAPRAEETRQLQMSIPGVTFLEGAVDGIPLEAASASKIVCNGVLIAVGRRGAERAARNRPRGPSRGNDISW